MTKLAGTSNPGTKGVAAKKDFEDWVSLLETTTTVFDSACLGKASLESGGISVDKVNAGSKVCPWFKVAVSVTDSDGPEMYQSQCIGRVSIDTKKR